MEECTKDGSVDHKGKPAIRSKHGGWKACSFVVVYEVFERMAYYGISSNLVLYLTYKLHQGTVDASNNVTNWVGTVWLTPIVGAYVADAHLGRYWTFIFASTFYLMGMCLLTLSVSLPSLRPCDVENCTATRVQVGVFFGALYILALGTGGTKPNISTIGADQFDEFEPKERAHKLSFFNWWMFSIFLGTLFANTVLVYIQDNVGWALGYALPTVGLAASIAVFVAGTAFYRHKLPAGSPFSKMAKVLVAAAIKWREPLPDDPQELFELDAVKFRIHVSKKLRFLNKASVKTRSDSSSTWRLSPVTHVEETKQMLSMIPVLVATFIPSTMLAQVNTLFVKQGTTLDRHMGPSFKIPAASLAAFVTLSMLSTVVLYDRFFTPAMRRWTQNPRGISLLQRMGIGMVLHIILMAVAAVIEHVRLRSSASGGGPPLTIFILLPQFLLMGVADAFLEVAKIEFFYDQSPEGMKSLGTSYATTSIGVGNLLSSFLLKTVSRLTKRHHHRGWILNDLNASHLDYYYALFAAMNIFNLLFFLLVTHFYVYRPDFTDDGGFHMEDQEIATPIQEEQLIGK